MPRSAPLEPFLNFFFDISNNKLGHAFLLSHSDIMISHLVDFPAISAVESPTGPSNNMSEIIRTTAKKEHESNPRSELSLLRQMST
jgi:hypothetical protein